MTKPFLIVAAAVAVATLIAASALRDSVRAVQAGPSRTGDVSKPVMIDGCGDHLRTRCEVTEAPV